MPEDKQPDQPASAPGSEAAKPAPPASKPAAKPAAKKPTVMETAPWESSLTQMLHEHFGDRISEFSTYVGQNFLVAQPDAVIPILEFLKLEGEFDYLVDVTATDYPQRENRFDLVYIVYSFARNERIRVKTLIPADYKPRTAVGVHLGANWLEREVYDMFGIEFEGHPDMKRILLPEDWEGFPLRKEKDILDMDNQWVQANLQIESGQ